MTTTTSTSRRSSSSGRSVEIHCSTRADGDFHLTRRPADELERRRRSLVDLPWTMADQRHGAGVVRVDAPGAGDREPGDIVITDLDDVVLGCWVADCAPLVVIGAGREFAVVHAGWRGLAGGVIQAAIGAFGEPVVGALLGPTIGPCCYEFGAAELDAVAAGVGCETSRISGSTRSGRRALDVAAAVGAACDELAVERIGGCTGCEYPGFSHRVRTDRRRHVVAAWRPSAVSS